MPILDGLAILATVYLLTCYFVARKQNTPMLFDWANMTAAIPICLAAVFHGAWASVPVTAAFGLIGAYNLWRYRDDT